jgi:hypothetical protein
VIVVFYNKVIRNISVAIAGIFKNCHISLCLLFVGLIAMRPVLQHADVYRKG